MSANLLDGITPELKTGTTESGGVWHNAGRTSADGHDDWLVWDLAGQSALATNQTYHVGLSVKGASANSASLHASIGYRDAAGKAIWPISGPLPIGTSWDRDNGTITVPSGMTPFAFYVSAYRECPETWMTAATLSCGSPVTLAASAHTPYATQDHVAAETKDLVTLRIDSSRGTVFRNSEVSTVLTVRCYKRGEEITTLTALRQAILDATARIRWWVLREGDTDWVSLADSDPMLSDDGFTLTVTPNDVSVKCTFKAEIITD